MLRPEIATRPSTCCSAGAAWGARARAGCCAPDCAGTLPDARAPGLAGPGARRPGAAVGGRRSTTASCAPWCSAHKERRRARRWPARSAELLAGAPSARPLGRPPARCVLVPVPSRPGVVRARGHDPTAAIDRGAAAAAARRRARRRRRAPLLRTPARRRRPGRARRRRAGAPTSPGSMRCPARGAAPARRPSPRARVVVCDDVITTGATAREAQRALEAVGLRGARRSRPWRRPGDGRRPDRRSR